MGNSPLDTLQQGLQSLNIFTRPEFPKELKKRFSVEYTWFFSTAKSIVCENAMKKIFLNIWQYYEWG